MPHKTSLQVVLNGQTITIDPQESLASVLMRLQLGGRPIAVEVNAELIPREHHVHHTLQAGDHIEVVTLVGGG